MGEFSRMKLNMYKTWDNNYLVSIILSWNKIKSWRKNFVYYEHNHTLKYLDIIKVNFKIKNTIVTKIAKKYQPSNISRNIISMR